MLPIRNTLIACAFAILSGSAWAEEPSLPGNATSLNETHGDWTVACTLLALPDGKKSKRCALSQQQFSRQTKQRALAIELTAENNGAEGMLVLRTKGSLSSKTARLMVFKLVMAAARTWRRLKGQNQLPKLIAGASFRDGIEVIELKPQSAA